MGYWIVQGDKTSCGGSVLEGHPKGTKFGPNQNRQAVNGSKVSCGKHPGTFSVGGGHPGEIIHGCYAASTLYSRSTCPCKAFFIPTHTWAKHGPYQGDIRKAAPVSVPMTATAVAPYTALEPLTHKEANFLHSHYGTIANFSNIADKGIGLAADPVGKYFKNIEKILKEIQETYKNTYMTRGALIGEQFYVRRAKLFKELEKVLKVGFLNKAMKFGEYTKIKNALGLSSSSITHKWNQTGISDIEGYTTHIERAVKYVTAMRYIGYVGIGFSALHSINEINEACSVGREDECTQKKYTEIGSFAGSTGGGILAGGMAVPLCIAIGVGTAGTGGLVCAVIAGGTLGYVGGEAGGWGGEKVGNTLYNVIEGPK